MTTYTTQFYESYIVNDKPNKHNPNNQNNDINMDFTTNTKFVLLQLGQRKFWSIHIQILTNFKKIYIETISYISSIPTWIRSLGPWGGATAWDPGVEPWRETMAWDPGMAPWRGWNIYILGWYNISVYIKDTHSTTSFASLFLRIEFPPLPVTKHLCWAQDGTFVPQCYLNGSKYAI